MWPVRAGAQVHARPVGVISKKMEIRDYQAWLQAWDAARGWEQTAPAHTLLHALEELGEVARVMLRREGYKPSATPDQWQTELREELSDVFVFLFKLAYQCDIDVEDALRAGMVKAETRHPVATGAAELARYLEKQGRASASSA